MFSGDSFYGKQMALEYEAWKDLNVGEDTKDITQEDYQMAALNTRAFGYESIRDTQENKEFWVNIGALAVIIGVTVLAVVVPPVGVPLALGLGAVYGSLEAGSAIAGKDWISGRELGTGERWFRGVLAPLDIIPGAAALKKFSGVARVTSFAGDLGKLGKTTAQSSIRKVNDLAIAAGKEASIRLKNIGAVMKERALAAPTKLAEGAIGAGRAADEAVENMINLFGFKKPSSEFAFAGDVVEQTGMAPHFFEDSMKGMVSKIDGINIGGKGVSGAGRQMDNVPQIKEVLYGEHILKGKKGRKELTPNTRYITEDGYRYTTDKVGRIVDVDADNLILKSAERNKGMQRVAGREDRLPDDDGGHLIGSQFNGPGDIDNLVAQNSQINRSGGEWYIMETEWAKALKGDPLKGIPPRKVSVKIEPIYSDGSLRPDMFEVTYTIEGKGMFEKEIKNQSGG